MDRPPSEERQHALDSSVVHYSWDNTLAPRLRIAPGDVVVVETRGGGDNYFSPRSTHEDVLRRPPIRGHALTGPIWIEGALPGDALRIEILDIETWDWGYTFIGEGWGLLADEFQGPFLKIWDLANRRTTSLKPGIEVPIEPFLGVVGVARAEAGSFNTMPPTRTGGNMDTKHLTQGSTLWLPVEVDGALLSLGDAHAAQGDGEVCITAIETGATARIRVGVEHNRSLPAPQYKTGGPLTRATNTASWYGTTGIGPDLMAATQDAIRAMIKHLVDHHRLTPDEAYVLCSVAVDLKINEVVGKPNWVVSACLPMSIFTSTEGT